MLLESQDLEQFFRLHRTFMFFVNQRLKVIPEKIATPERFAAQSPAARLKVRDAFLANSDLIQSFVEEDPFHFSEDELEIVRSWRHFVSGKFYVFRKLANYTVFVSTEKQPIAYGVLALSQPFEELIGPYLPVLVQTVLLPFKDTIVYDGILNSYRISFGSGIRRNLNEDFKEAKARHGIVTSLPMSNEPLPPKAIKTKPVPKPPTKQDKDESLGVVIGLIDQFCEEHLNEEYAVLCRKMAQKLARKRPSPLLHGKPNAWASGIIRAVGGVNFLHDKSQTPYMRATDIDHYLGTSPSSGAAKVAEIRRLLNITPLSFEWTLPSRMAENPLIWLLNVNGLMMDIRHAPREAQEVAFRKGLIPYIPADRQQGG